MTTDFFYDVGIVKVVCIHVVEKNEVFANEIVILKPTYCLYNSCGHAILITV